MRAENVSTSEGGDGKTEPKLQLELGKSEPAAGLSSDIDASVFWQEEGASRVRELIARKRQEGFLRVLDNIRDYAAALQQSPQAELDRFLQALRGGYIPPSSGSDPIANPEAVSISLTFGHSHPFRFPCCGLGNAMYGQTRGLAATTDQNDQKSGIRATATSHSSKFSGPPTRRKSVNR